MPETDTSSPSPSGKLEGARRALAMFGGLIGTITAVIGTLLALGVIHSLGGGGPSLAQAAVATIDQRTSIAECKASLTVPGRRYPLAYSGTFDFFLNRAQETYDFTQLSILFHGRIRPSVAVFRDGAMIYVKRARPIGGKLWVEANDALLFPFPNAGELFAYTTSPTGLLRSIRTSGEVKGLGKDLLADGTNATHYRGVIDLRKVADQAPPEMRADLQNDVNGFIAAGGQPSWPADAWVDDDGLIRQTALAFRLNGSTMSALCEMSHFGIDFNATEPPPNEVQTVVSSQQLYAALGSV